MLDVVSTTAPPSLKGVFIFGGVMTVKEKSCTRCNTVKLASEFYKRKANKSGLRSWCKQCEIKKIAEYQKTPRGKEVAKKYSSTQKGKERMRRYDQSSKGRLKHARYNGSKKGRAYYKKARENNPDKIKARDAVNNAVKSGKLPSAKTLKCVFCGTQAEEYHHHKGYSEDYLLDVQSACIKCHRKIDNGQDL